MPETDGDKIRLSKWMAQHGLCSRREADALIAQGLVRVDGQPVRELGFKITPGQKVELESAARQQLAQAVTILLNKPVGYVSGQAEKGYQPAAVLIRPENHFPGDPSNIRFQPSHLQGLAPAGRLDIDSHGLLVLTQDGRIARQLIGENSGMEKEYVVRVKGTITPALVARLAHGLALDNQPLKPAKVAPTKPDELRFTLREGRKRQIRRMCELVGLRVTGLRRIRIGNVRLGSLPLGQWRYLGENERF